MKLKSSTKIFIGFVVIVSVGYFGYKFVTDSMILNKKFTEIAPDDVTLIGVDPGSGYSIIVANQAAALVKGGNTMDSGERTDSEEIDMRKKIPLKEMMMILHGDEKPLGRFMMSLSDVKQDGPDWPTTQVIWEADDLKKAIAGDPKLKAKLESDLNVGLDGTPLEVVKVNSLLNGIVIRLPIPIDVNVEGKKRKMIGYFLEPYRPIFCHKVDQHLMNKNYTMDMLRGFYIEEAKNIATGKAQKETVSESILKRLSPNHLREYSLEPEQVLSSARTILNSTFISNARYEKDESNPNHPTYRLRMDLSDEGRDRLWQYSKLKPGTQLLFVVNGTAIAAPRVKSELPQHTITITRLTDEESVQDAVKTINNLAKGKGK